MTRGLPSLAEVRQLTPSQLAFFCADSTDSAKLRVDGVDRMLAVGGGLVGGVLAMVTIWLVHDVRPAQIRRAAQMGTDWWRRLGGWKILAQNRSGADHGAGT